MSNRFPTAQVPAGLRTAEFVLRPIVADDAEKDHAAVMETREELRLWEQSTWPEEDFTVEANRADLVGLEERHSDGRAYTYTVLSPDGGECRGCVYVFPTTATFLARSAVSPIGGARWDEVEAVVYFWARRTQAAKGMDSRLLDSLRVWFAHEWALERVVFVTNEQFAHQVDVMRRSDLRLEFELVEPGKAGRYLVFGSDLHRQTRADPC